MTKHIYEEKMPNKEDIVRELKEKEIGSLPNGDIQFNDTVQITLTNYEDVSCY